MVKYIFDNHRKCIVKMIIGFLIIIICCRLEPSSTIDLHTRLENYFGGHMDGLNHEIVDLKELNPTPNHFTERGFSV